MTYTLLIYQTPGDFALRNNTEKREAYWSAWGHYGKALRDAGVFVSGAGLQPPDAATTLDFRAGKKLVQDGPYADTKEQLGGFFILNVPDLDAALEWAGKCPNMDTGVVEIRPNLPPLNPPPLNPPPPQNPN